jgi:hypothetical protein
MRIDKIRDLMLYILVLSNLFITFRVVLNLTYLWTIISMYLCLIFFMAIDVDNIFDFIVRKKIEQGK